MSGRFRVLEGVAVEGEFLSFVVLDGADEGVVVGGTRGRDFAKKELEMARGGDGGTGRGILRCEFGVIALDGGAGGYLSGSARRKVKDHAGLDLERRAQAIEEKASAKVATRIGLTPVYGRRAPRTGGARLGAHWNASVSVTCTWLSWMWLKRHFDLPSG